MPKRALVIGPAGLEKWADPADLGSLPEGYRPATAEEQRAEDLRRQYGGLGAQAATAAVGAARGLTAGLSDVAAVEAAEVLGGEQAAARLRRNLLAAEEAHPILSGAAEVSGLVGGTLLTGGGAGAARGGATAALRATALPTRAIVGAGAMTERAIASGLTTRYALPQIGRAAVEGAGFTAGQYLSESALGNREVTAEKLVAAMGEGALFGGGLAGGLAVAGGALRGGTSRLARALQRPSDRAGRTLTEKVFGAPSEALATVQSLSTGVERETAARFLAPGAVGRETRRIGFRDAESIRQAASRSTHEGLDDIQRLMAEIEEPVRRRGGMKYENIRGLVATGNEQATATRAFGTLAEARSKIQAMIADPVEYGYTKSLKRLDKRMERYERRMMAASAKGEDVNATLFNELDTLKAEIGQSARAFQKNASEMKEKLHSFDALDDLYHGTFRDTLEDATLWGRAAELQKAINAPWTTQIRTSKRFAKEFLSWEQTGRFGKPEAYADAKKIDAHLRNLINPTADDAHRSLLSHLDNLESFAGAVKSSVRLTQSQEAAVTKLHQRVAQVKGNLATAQDALVTANQGQALLAADRAGNVVGGLVGGAIASGNPLAMAAAPLLGLATRPGQTAQQLAAIEQLVGRFDERLGATVRGMVHRAGPSRAVVGIPRLASAGRDALEDYRQLQARRDEARRESDRLATTSPEEIRRRVDAVAGDLRFAAPEIVDAAAASAVHRAAVLRDAAPQRVREHVLGHDPEPSDAELARWRRQREIVEDPESVFGAIDDGSLTSEDVDTLARAYPAMYDDMRRQVVDELVRAAADGRRPDWQERIALSRFARAPLEPLMDPRFIRRIQSVWSPQEQAGPGAPPARVPAGRVPQIAKSHTTGSARLESEDQS